MELAGKLSQPTDGVYCVRARFPFRRLNSQQRELTTTSEQTGVDPQLIIMTENGDVTKAMLAPETGLKAAIAPGAPGLEWFQSLVITDGPADKPDEECVQPAGDHPILGRFSLLSLSPYR